MKALAFGMALLGIFTACSEDGHAPAAGGPEAPMLTEVTPMEGALHLRWMNMQTDCDSVEAESKMEGTDYAVAFNVPGSADNSMDTKATDDMLYTYRLRCKKGAQASPYSNEMSANPHDVAADAGPDADPNTGHDAGHGG